MLQSGCRWKDAPERYGPATTLYNRHVRWGAKGVWRRRRFFLSPAWMSARLAWGGARPLRANSRRSPRQAHHRNGRTIRQLDGRATWLSSRVLQYVPHLERQRFDREGLGEQFHPGFEMPVPDGGILRIAGDEKHS